MSVKQQLYNQCKTILNDRLKVIQKTIADIQTSLHSETKSSAGDKHETGRAMLQLEREKAGNQLAEIIKTKEVLVKIDTNKITNTISLGSVIYTKQAGYFIAISVGKLKIKNKSFYAISPSTPIGQLLLGKTIGDTIVFREQKIVIMKVE